MARRTKATATRHRYLLGDSAREAARLRAQGRLWDPVSHALFDRLGVGRGWRVLEIGPGAGTLHRELRRRVRGPVDAVEPSTVFREMVMRIARRDDFGEGRVWPTPLSQAALPRRHYDLVFARWVFLFFADPLPQLRQLRRALAPGGVLALQDYHRGTLAMIPEPRDWPEFVEADGAFFSQSGGDASIGTRMPALLRRSGFEVLEVKPTIRTGSPGSSTWDWLTRYFLGVMDSLGRIPPLTPARAARLKREWTAAARVPTSLLIAPAVLDIVARRPR